MGMFRSLAAGIPSSLEGDGLVNAKLRHVALVGFAGISVLLRAGLVLGDDSEPKQPSPEVRKLLDDVAKAYRALPAYADHGEIRIESVVVQDERGVQSRDVPAKAEVTFARPNKIALVFGTVRVISDGSHLTTIFDPLKRYTVAPAPEAITPDTLLDGALKEILFSHPDGQHIAMLLTLLL